MFLLRCNDSLEAQVTDVGWELTFGTNSLIKSMHTVNASIAFSRTLDLPDNNYDLLKLPSGFYPKHIANIPCRLHNSDYSKAKYCMATVYPSGSIKIVYGESTAGFTNCVIFGSWYAD